MGKDNKEQKNTDAAAIVTRETVGLTLGVFSILIMLMLFTGSLIFGDLGASICSFLFGTFGFMSYFLFPCLLFAAAVLVMGKNPIKVKGFTLFSGLSLLFIGLLVHTIVTGGYTHDTYGAYLSACFAAGNDGAFGCSPFGALGGMVVYPFTALATNAGAIVIFVVAAGLCLYLTVNSVLIYKGIRLGGSVVKPVSEEGGEESEQKGQAAQAQYQAARPTRFDALDNVRTASGEEMRESAYDSRAAYGATNAGYTPVSVPSLQSFDAQGDANTAHPERFDQSGNEKEGTRSAFAKSYDILYGKNENPNEYRSKNLIFDSSSRYNSRIQNNNPAAGGASASDGYPNYSEYSSREIDREQSPNRQPREVIRTSEEQNRTARREYSVYKTDIFDSRTGESSAFGGNAPLQPRYKAPDPVPSARETDETTAYGAAARNDGGYYTAQPEREPFGREERNIYRGEERMEREEGVNEKYIEELPERNFEEERGRGECDRAGAFGRLFDEDENDETEAEAEFDFTDDEEDEPRVESAVPDFTAERSRTPDRREDFSVFSDEGRNDAYRGGSSLPESGEPVKKTPPAETEQKMRVFKDYVYPPVELFEEYKDSASVDYNEIERNKLDIVDTLAAFKIDIQITNVQVGPTFTRYDFTFPKNVNANSISKYANNIALALKVTGKVNICTNFANGTMAIEVPNKVRPIVGFRSLASADSYKNAKPGALQICIGKNVEGKTVTASLAKMTHLLVAGTTGSGKSVFLHEIIMSLIMKYSPEEVRLILIDPKQVEFSLYDNLPHLMINEILSDPNKIVVMLNWVINEMERRYTLFRYGGVRSIDEFNAATKKREEKLPKIVIIADEVADIMAVAKKEVEDRISRIAAKARAAGIHLVLATQRPTVEVITGTLKANLPSRFALRVSEELNSRIVLDESGAENLLGNGDLLYKWGSMFNAERVQASFIDTPEIQRVCDFIRANNEAYFDQAAADFIDSGGKQSLSPQNGQESDGEGEDEIEPVYIDALRFVVRSGSASISMIQRKCSVGYNKAGKIIEWMEINKYISEFDGAKSRKVLLTAEEFVEKFGEL